MEGFGGHDDGRSGADAPSGSQASPGAAEASPPSVSIPNAARVRRTICPFDTAPRDGTAFHILNTVRFNPLMERFEAVCHEDGGRKNWQPIKFAGPGPSVWLRLVPLPYELPSDQWFPIAFTATYLVRRKSFLARIVDRLLWRRPKPRKLKWEYKPTNADWLPASGIEARSDETPTAAQPEGREPGPKGDAQ